MTGSDPCHRQWNGALCNAYMTLKLNLDTTSFYLSWCGIFSVHFLAPMINKDSLVVRSSANQFFLLFCSCNLAILFVFNYYLFFSLFFSLFFTTSNDFVVTESSIRNEFDCNCTGIRLQKTISAIRLRRGKVEWHAEALGPSQGILAVQIWFKRAGFEQIRRLNLWQLCYVHNLQTFWKKRQSAETPSCCMPVLMSR